MTSGRKMSDDPKADTRAFLFLQGPHGPFFFQLAAQLRQTGARVWRVGFNAGDRLFWPETRTYLPFRGKHETWAETCRHLIENHSVTDLVLYGDTRAIHAEAITLAKAKGLRVHIFEEGYLRPYWITYERDGSNGNSRLMELSLQDMALAQKSNLLDPPVPPSHWGATRQHIFYGAVYHWCVLALNWRYRNFEPHRDLSVAQEFKLYLRKLVLMPFHATDRSIASSRIRLGRFPYHLVLLQLAHDASFKQYSPFKDQAEFIDCVLRGFAESAPLHHHLVFKAHPLEDGRTPLRKNIKRLAAKYNLSHRVHFVRGGKLARLLDSAKSAVTVNSTAAQQVLWRGLPLKAFGTSVYDKDDLVSHQSLPDFFRKPERKDIEKYKLFRDFLLSTSQIPGSFYSSRGRQQALRHVTDLMLAPEGPYTSARAEIEADKQHLRIVR